LWEGAGGVFIHYQGVEQALAELAELFPLRRA
jgi:hypothetical protein